MVERKNTNKAIATLLIELFCFDMMISKVSYLLADFSASELSAYRNVLGIIPSLIVMLHTAELRFRKKKIPFGDGNLLLSGVLLFRNAQLTFYSAIGFREMAIIAALSNISGLFILLLSIFFFRERVGKQRWGRFNCFEALH